MKRQITDSICGNLTDSDLESKHYKQYVNEMLTQFHGLNVNMSLKTRLLHSYLNFFPGKLGPVSDEHGERFHQDIATIEKRYQGKWTTSSLADYCWSLIHDDPIKKHVRSKFSEIEKKGAHVSKYFRNG